MPSIENRLNLAAALRETIQQRFPAMDAKWGVNRYFQNFEDNMRHDAKIIALMMPEVVASYKAMEKENAPVKAL